MAPKGRGYKVTPPRVLELLQKAVSEKSQYAVAKETGLSLSVIQGLLKGNREPSTSTLAKLEEYFNIPVATLRGESGLMQSINIHNRIKAEWEKEMAERLKEGYKKYGTFARDFIRHIPYDAIELELAVDVLKDVAEVKLVELLKEYIRCHDHSKK